MSTEAEQAREIESLNRALAAAITAHRGLHVIYGSTSVCGGGIGGQAITQHCGVTCGRFDRHQDENDRWTEVERAYFRRQEGDPNWAEGLTA